MKVSWAMFRRWLRFNWFYFGCPPRDTGISPPELQDFLDHTPRAGLGMWDAAQEPTC
jgi:hypothetical protein